MGMMGLLFWPFMGAFVGVMILVSLVFVILWIWMVVDCAKRKFVLEWEKFVWLGVIVFLSWLGIIVYYIVIRSMNPKGVMHK
jgi:hypothetical protein